MTKKYLEYLNLNDNLFHCKTYCSGILDIQDPAPVQGEKISWEESKFSNVPAICAISNLSALQLNIRLCEMMILRGLD